MADASPGATPTIDWTTRQKQEITLSANVTSITFTAPPGIGNFMLVIGLFQKVSHNVRSPPSKASRRLSAKKA